MIVYFGETPSIVPSVRNDIDIGNRGFTHNCSSFYFVEKIIQRVRDEAVFIIVDGMGVIPAYYRI
jgi:hypothetical protein